MVSGWAALLIASFLCGNLVSRQFPLPKVYSAALVILSVFVSVQLFPFWSKLISSAPEISDALNSDLKETLVIAGYTADQIEFASIQFKTFYAAFVRILPAFSILAAIIQFTAGFWLFMKWLDRSGHQYLHPVGFVKWKMPFVLTPVLVAAILMRLFGNDLLIMVADNLIFILAVFYAIAGVTLVEFFMKKFRFAFFSRFLVFLLFILTHIVGFAFLAVLGFTDSFFEWRRKYPLPLDFKTG